MASIATKARQLAIQSGLVRALEQGKFASMASLDLSKNLEKATGAQNSAGHS